MLPIIFNLIILKVSYIFITSIQLFCIFLFSLFLLYKIVYKKKSTLVTNVVYALLILPSLTIFFRYIESNKQPSPIKNVTLYICYQVVQGMEKNALFKSQCKIKFNNTLTSSDVMFSSDTFFSNPSYVLN